VKGNKFKGKVYEGGREQRVDIKSFVYFSNSFILFHIMNIITIFITLCRVCNLQLVSISYHRNIENTLVENTGANSTDFAFCFRDAPNFTVVQRALMSIEFFRKTQTFHFDTHSLRSLY